jgi:phospholipid/cholesterol/gamma-HCH transport system substrate-binding protein
MVSNRTKFAVGLFVTMGMLMVVAAMIWLGAGRYLQAGNYWATYFDESVQGLSIDAPVKYRGVPVGRVVEINVAPDNRLVEVIMKINPDYKLRKPGSRPLVATLKNIGITGSMFIELDRKRKDAKDLAPTITFKTKYPVIPSKPSELSQIVQTVDQTLSNINSIDFRGISKRVSTTLDLVNGAVKDARVSAVSRDIRQVLADVRALVNDPRWAGAGREAKQAMAGLDRSMRRLGSVLARIDSVVADNEQAFRSIAQNLNATSSRALHLVSRGSDLLEEGGGTLKTLRTRLFSITEELERSSEQLNQILERVRMQPSQLLFSRPPERRVREGTR